MNSALPSKYALWGAAHATRRRAARGAVGEQWRQRAALAKGEPRATDSIFVRAGLCSRARRRRARCPGGPARPAPWWRRPRRQLAREWRLARERQLARER